MKDKKRGPTPLSEALGSFLKRRGLAKRVDQASAIDDWASVVGNQIAAVTAAVSISPDGTLFVAVTNHAWMTELSLMEPDLLAAVNGRPGHQKVRKIRFLLER